MGRELYVMDCRDGLVLDQRRIEALFICSRIGSTWALCRRSLGAPLTWLYPPHSSAHYHVSI